MENSLSLKEKFILLCLNPLKGKPYWNAQFYLFGVSGAILLELADLQKIKIADKRLVVTDSKNTGDAVLDLVLEMLTRAGKNRRVQRWVQSMSSFRISRKIKKMILEGLFEKRILGKEEGTVLIFFRYNRYPVNDTRMQLSLKKSVQDYVLRDRENESGMALLSSLIGATQLVHRVFDKEDRKQAKKRLKEILKNNQVSQIVGETVSAVQAAIIASITTSAAATAASTR